MKISQTKCDHCEKVYCDQETGNCWLGAMQNNGSSEHHFCNEDCLLEFLIARFCVKEQVTAVDDLIRKYGPIGVGVSACDKNETPATAELEKEVEQNMSRQIKTAKG